MVATADIGKVAAELLQGTWKASLCGAMHWGLEPTWSSPSPPLAGPAWSEERAGERRPLFYSGHSVHGGHRVVELEGPERVTPNQIAATFARLLGRPVRMEAVPRESWEALFKSQGMKNPTPRIRMLDGFNEGWIDFGHGEADSLKGNVTLETVLNALINPDVH